MEMVLVFPFCVPAAAGIVCVFMGNPHTIFLNAPFGRLRHVMPIPAEKDGGRIIQRPCRCNSRVMYSRSIVGSNKRRHSFFPGFTTTEIYRNRQKSIHSMAQYNPVFLLDMQMGYNVNLINTTVPSQHRRSGTERGKKINKLRTRRDFRPL